MPFVFAQACVPAVPVWGEKNRYFPVHRVYAIAGNYADHLAEMGRVERAEPVFFTKPSDGLVVCKEGKSVEIPYPRETNSFCLEVELVVAIGKTAPETGFITPEEAEEYIFGYAAGVEFTRRNFQTIARENRQPWEKAKCFDNSALITEIREKHRMPDMDAATLWLYVDNQERQRGNTSQMMYSIPELVSEVSKYWRLTAGDLIYTGTPKGSGPIESGQSFEGGVNGAGKFSGKVFGR